MIEMSQLTYSLICGAVFCLTWLIRLESKILYLERDHAKLDESSAKMDSLFQSKVDRLSNDLGEIKISLVRIESRMFSDHHSKQEISKNHGG